MARTFKCKISNDSRRLAQTYAHLHKLRLKRFVNNSGTSAESARYDRIINFVFDICVLQHFRLFKPETPQVHVELDYTFKPNSFENLHNTFLIFQDVLRLKFNKYTKQKQQTPKKYNIIGSCITEKKVIVPIIHPVLAEQWFLNPSTLKYIGDNTLELKVSQFVVDVFQSILKANSNHRFLNVAFNIQVGAYILWCVFDRSLTVKELLFSKEELLLAILKKAGCALRFTRVYDRTYGRLRYTQPPRFSQKLTDFWNKKFTRQSAIRFLK